MAERPAFVLPMSPSAASSVPPTPANSVQSSHSYGPPPVLEPSEIDPPTAPQSQSSFDRAQNHVRAQMRQVIGVGPPLDHGSPLQRHASQLRQPVMMVSPAPLSTLPLETLVRAQLEQALNPFEDQIALRNQLTQALNNPPVRIENQVRDQIIRALAQAQNLANSQNQMLQALGLQSNQISTPLQADAMRTPLLQALNLSQQDLSPSQARLHAMRAAVEATMQSSSPYPASSRVGSYQTASFADASLNLVVNKDLLGSQAASTREDYVFLSDCSFRSHRHEELLNHVRGFLSVKELKRDLTKDERYYIAIAYKDSVRVVRDAWRKIRKAEVDQRDASRTKASVKYRAELEGKMRTVCAEGLAVAAKLLADGVVSLETRLYFYKVKGDLYRYMAEYSAGTEKSEAANLGRSSYEEADRIKSCVSAVHPLRLGLALNFGVFLRDACQDSSRGWRVTKAALDEANRGFQMLAELDSNDYRESNGLLMNLRRNLMRWNTAEVDMETQAANARPNVRA